VELRIVLDHSVAEVFTSDGDALTLRFYPVGTADWQLHVVGGGAVYLRAWELRALVLDDLTESPMPVDDTFKLP